MDFSGQMEALNNSPLFNVSGIATVLSFFGLNAIKIASWANINLILLVCIGVASLGFTLMKMYREYLLTKKLKRQMRKDDDKNN